MNWAEAEDRQDRDDGDPEDTVYITERPERGRIYHDELSCYTLANSPVRELSRRKAMEKQYGGCRLCTLNDVERTEQTEKATPAYDLVEQVRSKMADD